MGKKAPTEGELSASMGTMQLPDGSEVELTGAVFADIIRRGTNKENPDAEAAEKLRLILDVVLDYAEAQPDLLADAGTARTIKQLRIIHDGLPVPESADQEEQADQAPAEPLPENKTIGLSDYVTTKDILSKYVFGEPGLDGKVATIASKKSYLKLWTHGKGKGKKTVVIYTQLTTDTEVLKAAGITIGKNLSKRAREVYNAMLSHYLAGNTVISLGMMGELIFNSRSNNLTEKQKKYIIDGATEIFSTSLFVDTTAKLKDKDMEERGLINLNDAQNVKIKRLEQVFPGRITTGYINGNLTETVIELYKRPTLYDLQEVTQKQILRVPVELIKTEGRSDEDLITIRSYLLRRIDAMKHKSSLQRTIIFTNILEEVGIEPTEEKDRKTAGYRKKRRAAMERTERILNDWKTKNYIYGYIKQTKTGKPVRANTATYSLRVLLNGQDAKEAGAGGPA